MNQTGPIPIITPQIQPHPTTIPTQAPTDPATLGTMQKLVPNIWCNQNADEVAQFYAETFPNAETTNHQRYPTEGLLDFQQPMAGKTLTIDVSIDGFLITMINADDTFTPNPSISFMINNTAGREETDRLWSCLTDGGQVLMPLQEYPFNEYYGWVQDRFGVSWQIMTHQANKCEQPYIYPHLMFGGAAQNRAAEAMEHYTQVFDDSRVLAQTTYGDMGQPDPDDQNPTDPQTPITARSIVFGLAELAGQTVGFMDSGVRQPFSFTGGVALLVNAHGQDQLDRYWDSLSANPDAEQCGWLQDKFGLAWEIVPDNLDQLMQRPGAYQKLMQMKKIVIADF